MYSFSQVSLGRGDMKNKTRADLFLSSSYQAHARNVWALKKSGHWYQTQTGENDSKREKPESLI